MSLDLLSKNDSTPMIGGIKTFMNIGCNSIVTNSVDTKDLVVSGVTASPFYEEKKYNVTIGDGTNNFTTSTSDGEWIRIGNFVSVSINLVWTSRGTASGPIQVSLPFTVGADCLRNPVTVGYCSGMNWTVQVAAGADAGDNFVKLFNLDKTDGAAIRLADTNFANSGELHLSGQFCID
jgi:hypothetical protein